MSMIYYTDDILLAPKKNYSTDLGIDLKSREVVVLSPGEIKKIHTGTSFNFPLYGKLRRALSKLLTGLDVIGIGGQIWPRSRYNLSILAGIIDPGYRGEIIVKAYNPSNEKVFVAKYDSVAQMVLVPCIDFDLSYAGHFVSNVLLQDSTERGGSGGIHEI